MYFLAVLEIWLYRICKKKKGLRRRYENPRLYHKGNKGYKEKDRKKRMA